MASYGGVETVIRIPLWSKHGDAPYVADRIAESVGEGRESQRDLGQFADGRSPGGGGLDAAEFERSGRLDYVFAGDVAVAD